jgi:hypothetical protein
VEHDSLCDPKTCNLLTPTAVSLTKVRAIEHDLSPSLKQHLVIDSTRQRAIEGRVPNPCLRFSSKVKSLHAMIDLPSYDGAYPLVVGHTDAPFTAKPQKTHDKMRRVMRPRWPRDLDAQPTRGLAGENIGRSATPGPRLRVEQARLPLLVDPDSGRFATLFGQLALAIPAAAITAFVVLWTFTTA